MPRFAAKVRKLFSILEDLSGALRTDEVNDGDSISHANSVLQLSK
jgi:hypothetical protein